CGTPKSTLFPYTTLFRSGRIDNFLRAAGKLPADTMTAYPFDDTDLYKVIEGASYSLQTKKNPALARYLDTLIAIIGAAQEPDGRSEEHTSELQSQSNLVC